MQNEGVWRAGGQVSSVIFIKLPLPLGGDIIKMLGKKIKWGRREGKEKGRGWKEIKVIWESGKANQISCNFQKV